MFSLLLNTIIATTPTEIQEPAVSGKTDEHVQRSELLDMIQKYDGLLPPDPAFQHMINLLTSGKLPEEERIRLSKVIFEKAAGNGKGRYFDEVLERVANAVVQMKYGPFPQKAFDMLRYKPFTTAASTTPDQ